MNVIKKHVKLISVTALLLVALTVGAVIVFSTPKPKSEKPEDIAAFAASSKFASLPDSAQEEYLRKLRQDRDGMRKTRESMSEAQRKAMFENMRALYERKQIAELRKYFKMSKAEKNQYLDAKIAEQDQRMAEFAKRREAAAQQQSADKKNQPQQQRQRPSQEQMAAMMKNRIETTSPEVRAARQKMMQDLMKRRQETGKKPPQGRRGG